MREPDVRRWWAMILGSFVLVAVALSALLGRANSTTALLAALAAPLVYGGAGLPLPKLVAGVIKMTFEDREDSGRSPLHLRRGTRCRPDEPTPRGRVGRARDDDGADRPALNA